MFQDRFETKYTTDLSLGQSEFLYYSNFTETLHAWQKINDVLTEIGRVIETKMADWASWRTVTMDYTKLGLI